MEAKFDPKAKVKQGQFSDAPDGNTLILILQNMHQKNTNLLSMM